MPWCSAIRYDDYTLKAAQFPAGFDLDAIDYDDSSAILDAVAKISTPVGFNDMASLGRVCQTRAA